MLSEGVRLALDTIGLRSECVGYVEREASAAAVIVAGLAAQGLPAPAIWDDARTFDGGRFRGCVDIFTAGYPCQPFSLAGKRRGECDARHLWPEVHRAIEEIEPGIVFLENVAGHLRLGYAAVERDLLGLGYTVTPGLFSAEEVGDSQKRERLFILANADGVQCVNAAPGGQDRAGESVAEAGEELAGASANGRKDCVVQSQNEVRQEPDERCPGIPVFPPGPNDFRSWAAVAGVDPAVMPAIESDVRRVADGMAPWSERLRLLGNGVVPLAAAYAFLSLWACSGGHRHGGRVGGKHEY